MNKLDPNDEDSDSDKEKNTSTNKNAPSTSGDCSSQHQNCLDI